jgi:hypothetical protein
MVTEYYLSGNVWLPSALRGHFLDLCSAFKLAIHILSFQAISRNVYKKGDADVEDYLDALNNLQQTGGRKYQTKKWWS